MQRGTQASDGGRAAFFSLPEVGTRGTYRSCCGRWSRYHGSMRQEAAQRWMVGGRQCGVEGMGTGHWTLGMQRWQPQQQRVHLRGQQRTIQRGHRVQAEPLGRVLCTVQFHAQLRILCTMRGFRGGLGLWCGCGCVGGLGAGCSVSGRGFWNDSSLVLVAPCRSLSLSAAPCVPPVCRLCLLAHPLVSGFLFALRSSRSAAVPGPPPAACPGASSPVKAPPRGEHC